jgi:phage terminase large subunit
MALDRNSRHRILCTRETQNSLSDSALSVLKRVIADYGLTEAFTQTKHGLKCPGSGSEFIFRGLQEPHRIKSLDGITLCLVEEAQSVSKEAWDNLIPTIREPDSEIWVSFNPDLEDDPAYQMFVVTERPDAEVVKINYDDNPYFPPPLQKELDYDKETDFERYQHVWEGEPRTISNAQVFHGKWRTAVFETPEGAAFYYGADWGFAQDPTTLVRCYIDGDVLYVDREAYGVGVEIDETARLFESVPDVKRWPITADSARPELISHLRRDGFNIRGAAKGKGSVESGIEFLRSFREIVVHERCKHTADELKHYSYKVDKRTGDILPILVDAHNHMIDALRYAVEKIWAGKEPRIRTL